jgi:hypothetical protein
MVGTTERTENMKMYLALQLVADDQQRSAGHSDRTMPTCIFN